jgi:hypothetical protein
VSFSLQRLWLRLLPYSIAKQNKLKFKHMLKLSSSYDSVRFILMNIWTEWVKNCYILCRFQFLTMFYTIVGAGVVRAGVASRYGSGSDQKMRLRNTDLNHHLVILDLQNVSLPFETCFLWRTLVSNRKLSEPGPDPYMEPDTEHDTDWPKILDLDLDPDSSQSRSATLDSSI